MYFPFAPQGLIVEPLDKFEPFWSRRPYNVLPFFITLEHMNGQAFQSFGNTAVLIYFPHIIIVLYLFWYAYFGLTYELSRNYFDQPGSCLVERFVKRRPLASTLLCV